MWVGEAEFIEVVDVGDAEIERRNKGRRGGGDIGEEVEGNKYGAEEDFLRDRAGHVVAVANPREKGGGGRRGLDTFDEEALEEGPSEEGEGEEERREDRRQVDGVPAQQVK